MDQGKRLDRGVCWRAFPVTGSHVYQNHCSGWDIEFLLLREQFTEALSDREVALYALHSYSFR